MFNLQGKIINKHVQSLLSNKDVFYSENLTLETRTKAGIDISISQTSITQATLPVGKILVIRDISSRKETERSYKNLIKSSGDIIYNLDLNGNLI